jgi:hypothetical protein
VQKAYVAFLQILVIHHKLPNHLTVARAEVGVAVAVAALRKILLPAGLNDTEEGHTCQDTDAQLMAGNFAKSSDFQICC